MPLARTARAWALCAALALAAPCRAEIDIAAGLERFAWDESVTPAVRERGTLRTFSVGVRPSREAGWRLGYQGKLYAGDVDYSGATLSPPVVAVHSKTRYSGMWHEAHLRYRVPRDAAALDVLGALGLEQWRRQLSANQVEDFRVTYLRLGLELGGFARGWFAGGGLRYPLAVEEDAHLASIGFAGNPTLEPGRGLAHYARIGYRFSRSVSVLAYTDGYRFKESARVANTTALGTPVAIYQPASELRVTGLAVQATLR